MEEGGIQSDPGKRTCPVNICAMTQPTDQISTTWRTDKEMSKSGENGREIIHDRVVHLSVCSASS